MTFGWFVVVFIVGLFFIHFPRTKVIGWVMVCCGAGLIVFTLVVAMGFAFAVMVHR